MSFPCKPQGFWGKKGKVFLYFIQLLRSINSHNNKRDFHKPLRSIKIQLSPDFDWCGSILFSIFYLQLKGDATAVMPTFCLNVVNFNISFQAFGVLLNVYVYLSTKQEKTSSWDAYMMKRHWDGKVSFHASFFHSSTSLNVLHNELELF